jgi:ppGpp synthetase/RelA/SpoT-type nucleotidyltranferase/tetratricopeptide (TPR) repeat protein
MDDDNEFNKECQAVAYRADQIHKWLAPILGSSTAAKKAYAFKGRLKSSGDVREKVLSRRNDLKRTQPNYAPAQVTDVSGFRIVRLFNAEVPEALDQLLALLKTDLPPGDAKGCVKSVKEIEFHTSRRLDDPLSIYGDVKRVVEANGHTLKPPATNSDRAAASSYSSVHVLLECQAESVSSCTEIQLRSVFEEAWGEISHRLKYAPGKVARATGVGDIAGADSTSEFWLHLDALKSLTDGCAQYADLINRQILRDFTGPAERKTMPLDPPEKSVALFAAYGPEVIDRVKAAYRQRNEAAIMKEPGARAAAFRAAAAGFQAALAAFPNATTDEDRRRQDILREELAYGSMFGGNAELTARAEKTYRELCVTRPERVSVWLRLGQLRRDAGAYEEAKSLMEEGLRIVTEPGESDPDIQRQANWLLRRDLAYVCWRIADLEPGRADVATLLAAAIRYSEESLHYIKTDDQRLNTLQNLLYYLVAMGDISSASKKTEYSGRGSQVLDEIRPRVNLETWSLEELDTIARAEFAFGRPDLAKAAAGPIAQKLTERITEVRRERNLSHALAFETLSRDERDMLLFAQEALRAGKTGDR